MASAKFPRAAEQQGAAFASHVPENVVWEILTRLPAKTVVRFRAVCKAWRDLAYVPDFLLAHHRGQQPQPLFVPLDYAGEGAESVFRHYRLEAVDLRTDERRPIIQFTENKYIDYVPDLHPSLDGLLLVSFVDGWYVCNSTTRQWTPLPMIDWREVVGLYAHGSSGEYRVLYYKVAEDPGDDTCYYVLTLGSQEARSIGCLVSPAAPDLEYVGLEAGLEGAFCQPPSLVRRRLHWSQKNNHGSHILVFDTEAEVFTWMSSPATPVRDKHTKLLEMEGKLAMSVSGVGESRLIPGFWRIARMRSGSALTGSNCQWYRSGVWVTRRRVTRKTGGCHGLSRHKGMC